MPQAIVNLVQEQNTSVTITDTTVGNVLIVFAFDSSDTGSNDFTGTTISDNAGNVYTLTKAFYGNNATTGGCYVAVIATGGTLIITSDGGQSFPYFLVYEIAGVHVSSPVLAVDGISQTDSASTSVSLTLASTGAWYAVYALYTNSMEIHNANSDDLIPGTYLAEIDFDENFGFGIELAIALKTELSSPPTVSSPTKTSITKTTATLGGNISSDGGSALSATGIVISKTSDNVNPIIGGFRVTNISASPAIGVFTVSATGLLFNTAYSYAAYAINSQGTTYSSVDSFTTLNKSLNLIFGTGF